MNRKLQQQKPSNVFASRNTFSNNKSRKLISLVCCFLFMLLILPKSSMAGDEPTGYIRSAKLDTCTGVLTIQYYVLDYDEINTYANADLAVNGIIFASVKGDDNGGDYTFTKNGTDVSVYFKKSNMGGDHYCHTSSSNERCYVTITWQLPVEILAEGDITVSIENLGCTGDNCGATEGDQSVELGYPYPANPTNISVTTDATGIAALTWENGTENVTGVEIYRAGALVETLSGGETSWEDPTANTTMEAYTMKSYYTYAWDEYNIVHLGVIVATVPAGSCDIYGEEVEAETPEPPMVTKPSNLKASAGRCDGKILVSWSYNGDVEPSSFVLKTGSSSATISGDVWEYEYDAGAHKTGVNFQVKAVGLLNESDFTSVATGSTSGPPVLPSDNELSIISTKYDTKIDLEWDAATYTTKYLLKRNSPSGESEFEITSGSTYSDKTVNICETYQYQLYAGNECTDEQGISGLSYDASLAELKLESNLNGYISTSGIDASKTYYPDKIKIEWTVNGSSSLVDRFIVQRRLVGTSTWQNLATVEGAFTYDDFSTQSGKLYEYQVFGEADCGTATLPTNKVTSIGLRIPYGMVNGHIEYQDGVAVRDVHVLAEKASGAIGKSLLFTGSGGVSIGGNSYVQPPDGITVEAWIKPTNLSGVKTIVSRFSGANGYRLEQQDDDISFNVKGQTVIAFNALQTNTWTHVAGVYDITTGKVKIFINGRVPFKYDYFIDNADITSFEAMDFPDDVIAGLSEPDLLDQHYTTGTAFLAKVEEKIGAVQKELYTPFLIPAAENEVILAGAIQSATGPITHGGSLNIGSGFNGYIDEVRIWTRGKTDAEMRNDYSRILAGNSADIAGYWRIEEGVGSWAYDVAQTGDEFHKNHGSFGGDATWNSSIPSKEMLGWRGVTDENGDYIIPYVPYFGSGENFSITPIFEQHQFKPTNKTVFLGEGAQIADEQNFIDLSSFEVNGYVSYEDTPLGVEGVIIKIDGEEVIRDGVVQMTDQTGYFNISVPVGKHFISVEKLGHVFKSEKFPPGPTDVRFDFQEPLTGINFIDQTKVTIKGRVVGGTVEGDKKIGFNLSNNNIGQAVFAFEDANKLVKYPVTTDANSGEYSIDIPPLVYYMVDFDVPKNPLIKEYFGESKIADFSEMIPKTKVSHDFSGPVDATIFIDKDALTATIEITGVTAPVLINDIELVFDNKFARFIYLGEAHLYELDPTNTITEITTRLDGNGGPVEVYYHYRYDLIYRTPPQVRVTDIDGESEFTGEKVIQYEDPYTHAVEDFDVGNNPFNYPVFKKNNQYALMIHVEEVYLNQDVCPGNNVCAEAVEDRVLVDDGEVIISNTLATQTVPPPGSLDQGKATYSFYAGKPSVLADANFPWRDYSGILNITVKIGNNGYEWKPIESIDQLGFTYPLPDLHPDDKYFRAYVFGANPIEGSDFITNGPDVVDMILRDPPGNESYSYLEKGSTISFEESLSVRASTSVSASLLLDFGPKISLGTPLTPGPEIETFADLNLGFESTKKWETDNSMKTEMTINESWKTSDEPYLPGAPSDLFFGSSKNFIVSLADRLTILPVTFAEDNGIKTAGKESLGFKVSLSQSLYASPDGNATHFIYTADHIENRLIPNLINLRNNLFVSSSEYTSNIPISHELYGSNNDDPLWGADATTDDPVNTDMTLDYDGPSYTYNPEKWIESNGATIPENPDMVREYNQQIRLWRDALERNEMEKYHSKVIKNISFDAGPYFEYSSETSITQSHTSSFEASFDGSAAFTAGVLVNGVGVVASAGISFDYSSGKTTTDTYTNTNTFGYLLHDADEGDYFSVDVRDPGTGTGPVFIVQGGRSMCPHEAAPEINFYEPAKYEITDDLITKIEAMDVNPDLVTLLSWAEKTGKFTYDELKDQLPFSTAIDDLIPGEAKFQVEQVKDRVFKNKLDLVLAIEGLINIKYDTELEDNKDFEDVIKDNLKEFDIAGIADDISDQLDYDGNGGINYIYLFSPSKREALFKEWARFRNFIYAETETSVKAPESIGTSTLRREFPLLDITPTVVTNVPDDNKAYFTLQLGNNSLTKETQFYHMKVLESSNPDGAVIKIDGAAVQRGYLVGSGELINKTLSVEMGKPDVYHYEDLQLIFYSACERELVGFISSDMDADAIDTVSFSVHFLPSCTDIDVISPKDNFVINYEDEVLVDGVKQTKVPIVLSGYDISNTVFEMMEFQFKTLADPQYAIQDQFYKVPTGEQNPIDGAFQGLEWDLSGLPDGEYQIRAKTGCGLSPDGSQVFDLSEVWSGVVDRKPPKVFGSPQPADGILSPDDDIILEFNEKINGEKLSVLNNFDIRGILNGTELRHDVCLRFDSDVSNFVRIPDGLNLAGKSFTIEFWINPTRDYIEECIISQSSDPSDALYLGFNSSGVLELHLGDAKTEFDNNIFEDLGKTGVWNHVAVIYDHLRKETMVYVNGILKQLNSFEAEYSGFGDIIIGKSLMNPARPFKGLVHELRIWERPRTASKLASNMLISLSGKETGLIGYWQFNEASGTLAVDKVHKRNATINTHWELTPKGYAAQFTGNTAALEMPFSDIAFTEEQDFTIEFWFKSEKGENTCFVSNGRGDADDFTVYYITPEVLAEIQKDLPLEVDVQEAFAPMMNNIYAGEYEFINEVSKNFGADRAIKYSEQILRFAKIPPTYWSINTNEWGQIQINNNNKRMLVEDNYFDNFWHHFALVVQRNGNTRVYIDGEMQISEPSTEWVGFGGSKLFIGARAWWNIEFMLDQHFEGFMDEIRIWNTSLKQSQIQRNMNMRLDGDELGLAAWFPFETYEELMGVPVIESVYDDLINARNIANYNVLKQQNDVPNIRMKRPTSKVDFDFVYDEKRVSFMLNEPPSKIENCILDITARNVEDMYRNKMTYPVTWSAFVDLNQMKWDEQEIILEKPLYAELTFTATIKNSSGKQQNFSIENLPPWLTAEPREGTLDPLTSQVVSFTINPGLNIGRYEQNINLRTDFEFDEKLLLNLRVFKELPEVWNFNPSDFEYSMNIIGRVLIDNVVSIDKYDKAAAFVDGECRGIAQLQYIEEYDMYEVFLDVYSNVETGEHFEIRLWDASTGREYTYVVAEGLNNSPAPHTGKYIFTSNESFGSPAMPINFEAESSVRQEITLRKGWNWISFNLELDEKLPLVLQLNGLEPGRGDMIKGIDQYAQYTDGWFGSLNFLNNNTMYMFKTKKTDTLFVNGKPVDTEKTPMTITQGWNWIGYTPQLNIEINEALGRINPSPGDLIKSQYAFAMYDKYMGWLGTLEFMAPNMGYMYKYEPSEDAQLFQELIYPKMGQFKNKPVKKDYIDKLLSSVNVHDFAHNMPLIAIVDDGILSGNYTVVAYNGNQIRGIAYPSETGIEDYPFYFVMTYGNVDDEPLTFKLVDAEGREYFANEILSFNTKEATGTLSEPFILTINNQQTSINNEIFGDEVIKCMAYPNPFSKEINIVLQLPESCDVKIEIIDIRGRIVKQLFNDKMYEGRNTIRWKSTDKNGLAVDKGVYFARIITEKGQTLHKIIKF